MLFDIDPLVDLVFKRLFGVESNKPLLIDMLNSVLMPPPGEEIVDVTLVDPFNLRDFRDDKLSIVDVKCTDRLGRRFLVEMQMIGFPELPKRSLFYWARNYSDQLRGAVDYSVLQPVIVILFLAEPLYPQTVAAHQVFRLRADGSDLTFTDDIEFHTIELSKFVGRPGAGSPKLDRWSYFLTQVKGHEMSHFPQEMLTDPIFQKAFEELEQMSNDPSQRAVYQRRLDNLRDEKTRLASALRRGFSEGRGEGREEGREEGLTLGQTQERQAALKHQISFLERVLRLPLTAAETLDALPLDELARRAAELEQQCLSDADRRPTAESN